jgi:hypothetical protein
MAVLSRVYDEFLTTSPEHLLVGQGKFGARPRYPLRLLWLPSFHTQSLVHFYDSTVKPSSSLSTL